MKQPPILVTGAPRSSTTFLGNMLALPDYIVYVDEPFNTQTGIEGVGTAFPSPARPGGLNSLEVEYADLVEQLLSGRARFKPSRLRPGTRNPARWLARAMFISRENLAYRVQSLDPRKQRYLIKDPMAFTLSEYLHQRFGMQTVVIMRHPLSTVASYKRLDWHYDVEKELLPWAVPMSNELKKAVSKLDVKNLKDVERWSLLWLTVYSVLDEFMKRNPDMIFLTHEELSTNPHGTLEKLYSMLGLEYSPSIRQKVTEYTNAENPVQATDNQVHVLHRNSAEVIRGWKKLLTPEEVKTIHDICGSFAGRYYSDSSWK